MRVEKAVQGLILEEAHPLHGQVGAVELEHEAAAWMSAYSLRISSASAST